MPHVLVTSCRGDEAIVSLRLKKSSSSVIWICKSFKLLVAVDGQVHKPCSVVFKDQPLICIYIRNISISYNHKYIQLNIDLLAQTISTNLEIGWISHLPKGKWLPATRTCPQSDPNPQLLSRCSCASKETWQRNEWPSLHWFSSSQKQRSTSCPRCKSTGWYYDTQIR